jgi:hypothetical protein
MPNSIGSRAIPPCKNMGIRDFAANRSFSGNGLWQWDEKQGLARHAEWS